LTRGKKFKFQFQPDPQNISKMEEQYKKIFITGMLFLLCNVNLFPQGPDTLWTKTYGGPDYDTGFSVLQTSDGGYIISGRLALGYVYIIKTDTNGDTLWTKKYFGYDGRSIQATPEGGYIVAGYRTGDVFLVKTDANGDTVWTRSYGGVDRDFGYSVLQTSDGGYIIAGRTESFGAGKYDIYLIKTDANGDTIWTKTYGGAEDDYGYSIQALSCRGYIITGYTKSYGMGGSDVYLIKTDSNGDTLWTKTYGGPYDEEGWEVQETTDGGYIIAGHTYSFGSGNADVLLIKTNANGDTLWTKTYGGTGNDLGFSIKETFDSGYVITGYTYSFGAGSRDVYLIKINRYGDLIWTRTYGGVHKDCSYSVQQTSDGGYIITGWTESFGVGLYDVYLIKTNPIKLTSPNGGEVLEGGTVHTITWWCEYPPTSQYFFQLLLSLDSGASYSYGIVKKVNQDSTSWYWTVPNINCSTCRVKIKVYNLSKDFLCEDESDSDFWIFETGIEEKEIRNLGRRIPLLEVVPNPYTVFTTIHLSDIAHYAGDKELEIYDLGGRLVKSFPLTTNHLFLSTDLMPGVYFFKAKGYKPVKVIKLR